MAIAKSVAAVVTGSASILAEAAHSWADTGNQVLLLVADRRSRRPPDRLHPFGHGREAYVWALLAALGLFVAGAAVSVTHGVQELLKPEAATDLLVGYIVLGVSFVLEGISFLRSVRQARPTAESGHEIATSVLPTFVTVTLRAGLCFPHFARSLEGALAGGDKQTAAFLLDDRVGHEMSRKTIRIALEQVAGAPSGKSHAIPAGSAGEVSFRDRSPQA